MNKFLSFILLGICLNISFISAQEKFTISGYIKDSLTHETLIGATITDGTLNGGVSNSYGFYSITVNTNIVNLKIRYLGYSDVNYNLKLKGDTVIDIYLSQLRTSLSEVEIRANAIKFSKLNDLGVVVVSSNQLKYIPSLLGEKDIFKFFQLQPGVSSGKEGGSGLNIRGGSADQTLILMDDVPIYNSAHAFGFLSIFSGDYIKSAELYKGYIPSQYGGRLSGVATMNIRDGNRNEHKQSLQVGTIALSGLVEGPINKGKGSYLVGGRFFMPELILRGVAMAIKGDNFVPVIGFHDLTAKITYDLGKKTSIYGSFYTGRDVFSVAAHGDDYDGEKSKSKTGFNWGNIVGTIRLSSELNNKTFLNVTTYYSYLHNNKYSNSKITQDNETRAFLNSKIRSTLGEAGLKANLTHNITSWYELTYGLNFAYQHFVPQDIELNRDGLVTQTDYGNRDLFTTSLFADNKFKFGKFHLNLGGRLNLYTNNSESVFVAEPRLSLTYKMRKSSIWLSYVENSQPLFALNQQYFNLPVDYWIPFQNAEELPRSRQIALGYKQHFDFGLEFQTEIYYKRSRNISMVYNVDDFLLEDGGYNLAKGEAYGIEFIAQYSYKGFNIMGSYTYSKSMYDINGKKVPFMFDTPHNLNLLASYETLNKNKRVHNVSINIGFKTGLPYIFSNETYSTIDDDLYEFGYPHETDIVNYPQYANVRLNNFFRIDLNYTMEKKLKKGSRIWQFSLLNATAHRNPYVVFSYKNEYKAITLIPILPSFSYTRRF